jgi:DNA-binding response OmpR family regulator
METNAPRILVVEDDLDMGVFLEIALTVAGYTPIVTLDSRAKCIDAPYDLALVDLLLGEGMTGIELIEKLVARGVIVVGMTGLAEDAPLVQDAHDCGVAQVLHKPFDLPRIRAVLAAVR